VEAPPQIDVALDPAPTAAPEPVPVPVPVAPPHIEAEAPHIDVAVAEPAAEAVPHAEAETVAYIAHPPAHEAQAHDEHGATGPIDVSVEMFLWTLGTFLLMAWLLTKLAWRPILGALDKREEELRQAVDNAEQVRVELDTIEEKRSHIILDADTKAKEIVDRARVAGREAGRVLTEKAKQEATIIQENTQRELHTAREKAVADLRQESVDRAIELTEKILEQKMTPAQQRKLTERLIDQI
jgi:F-type H+-transporting ATPase subunit b